MQVLPLRPIHAASASLPVPELLTDSHGHVTIGSPTTRCGNEFLRRLESSMLSFVLHTSVTRRRWRSISSRFLTLPAGVRLVIYRHIFAGAVLRPRYQVGFRSKSTP